MIGTDVHNMEDSLNYSPDQSTAQKLRRSSISNHKSIDAGELQDSEYKVTDAQDYLRNADLDSISRKGFKQRVQDL